MWKTLERLQRDPRVAVASHSNEHAQTARPEFVLVQGTASFTPLEDRGYVDSIAETWDRFAGARSRRVGPLWRWWLDVWHWRVGITIDVERVVVWPDLACRGEPHTEAGYRFPTSWLVYRLVAGGYTRLGLRSGRRAGFLPD